MKKLIFFPLFLFSYNYIEATNGYDIRTMEVKNKTAYIPSMCYTKTKDNNNIHNPCYACHINSKKPNFVNDYDLQLSYAFPLPALKNPYSNLFKDFSKLANKISDKEVIDYVNESNYFDKNGNIILAKKLKNLPKEWDFNNNGKWDGYIPDCYYNFDKDGFDRDKNGNFTGWFAFKYTPFLGTFWPTNGSTDDVLIRLPKIFRTNNTKFDKKVYLINLTILEALIKQKDVKLPFSVDEKKYHTDLNGNNRFDKANVVKFRYPGISFIADAKNKKAIPGLYPVGTEFLHSVRYIGIKNGKITLSPRMKELRYGIKKFFLNYSQLEVKAQSSIVEDTFDGDMRPEEFSGNLETGLANGYGWFYQGFIEDKYGNLRPQSYEETLNCMGCHSNIGVTADTTFAFLRKVANGYWDKNYLKGIKEPKEKYKKYGLQYEYTFYLKNNKSGNEFRDNLEVEKKFFDKNGKLKEDMIKKLHNDISILLYPSIKRAIELNRGYMAIVKTQSFIFGRVGHIKPIRNVYKKVKEDQKTGIKEPILKDYQ